MHYILTLMLSLAFCLPAMAASDVLGIGAMTEGMPKVKPLNVAIKTSFRGMKNGHTKRSHNIRYFDIQNNGASTITVLSAKTKGCLSPQEIREEYARYSTTKAMWAGAAIPSLFFLGIPLLGVAVASPFTIAADNTNRSKLAKEVSEVQSKHLGVLKIPAHSKETFGCVAQKWRNAGIVVVVEDAAGEAHSFKALSKRTQEPKGLGSDKVKEENTALVAELGLTLAD